MGYAPNDRDELLDEEIKIGIKSINKSLIIGNCVFIIYVIDAVALVTVAIAALIVDQYHTVEGVPEVEVKHFLHFFMFLFWYIACVIFLKPCFAGYLPRKYFKFAYYFTIVQMALLLFWIIGFNGYWVFKPNSIKILQHFIIPISLQVLFIPLLFVNAYISSQLFLKISKLRPEYDGDDLYEVIEGSEGSSTKKIDFFERDQKHF